MVQTTKKKYLFSFHPPREKLRYSNKRKTTNTSKDENNKNNQ